jgi:hypothetical protein
MDWESADDESFVAVAGSTLGVFPAKGILYRPATIPPPAPAPPAPTSRSVPELKAAGPHGLATAPPRAITPWAVMAAIGKEGSMLVRIKEGHAVLVDAGGAPRAMTLNGLAAAQLEMAVQIDKILITHPHTDHVRNIKELILGPPPIHAKDLVISRSWKDVGRIKKELVDTTDQRLIDLGYGAGWEPQHVVEGKGVVKLTTSVEGTQIARFPIHSIKHISTPTRFTRTAIHTG